MNSETDRQASIAWGQKGGRIVEITNGNASTAVGIHCPAAMAALSITNAIREE